MKAGNSVREPAVAGQFYDSDPESLRHQIEQMLAGGKSVTAESGKYVQAVIVPHAGYVYSGKTAAKTLKTAGSFKYKRAIVISPSHSFPFKGLALSSYDAYRTPLGCIPVDKEMLKEIRSKKCRWINERDEVHIPEHSLEVELPFLQVLFPELPIVPIVCGNADLEVAGDISEVLYPFMNSETLWVVSSDFTHFGRQFGYRPFTEDIPEKLRELDTGAVEKIISLDCSGFSDYVEETGATICGANPIKVLLKTIGKASRHAGSVFLPELVEYTTSGELTGDYSHTVSYAGIVIYGKNL
ncbi:MAG: AmmeMemoRadiSam system protein B [Lentisphaerae bacterium]|nr:AmmeMemoRadiSam system protein B [Lentisphaerota bacterium]